MLNYPNHANPANPVNRTSSTFGSVPNCPNYPNFPNFPNFHVTTEEKSEHPLRKMPPERQPPSLSILEKEE
jgi:hypothetical protein